MRDIIIWIVLLFMCVFPVIHYNYYYWVKEVDKIWTVQRWENKAEKDIERWLKNWMWYIREWYQISCVNYQAIKIK
mgnify:CR=1 FL=1